MGKTPLVFPKDEPKLTQQSAKDECDINQIVERARRGADLSAMVRTGAMYGDFSSLPDLKSALLIVRQAESLFGAMDAHVRKRFGNDPVNMIEFLKDDRNRDEAIALGLVKDPKVPAAPVPAPPVAGAPAAPAGTAQ